MQQRKKRFRILMASAAVTALVIVGSAVAFVQLGVYNVAADAPHHPATHAVLERLREASIAAHSSELEVPGDLMSPARVTQGAGNYHAMCMGCHLAPGMAATEMSRGLYPAPPDLTREVVGAAETFWVIKHGIKASGMPAWGKSMGDEYIWNMVAFLQRLPSLNEAQYADLVARSGGHSHGGGETRPHDHAEGTPADHHAAGAEHAEAATPASQATGKDAAPTRVHIHADGKQHVHAAPAAVSKAAPATVTPAKAAEPPALEADDHGTHEHKH